jgi:hypothetical protein
MHVPAIPLLSDLAVAWAGDPPALPEWLKTDRECGRCYKYIAGRKWDEIDLEHRKIGSEWGNWLPPESREYYLATYLNYLLRHFPGSGVDVPFFAACSLLCQCDRWEKPLPAEKARVARLTIVYLLNTWPQFEQSEAGVVLRSLESASERWAKAHADIPADYFLQHRK